MREEIRTEELKQAHTMYSQAYDHICNKLTDRKEIMSYLSIAKMDLGLCFFFRSNFRINTYERFRIMDCDSPQFAEYKAEQEKKTEEEIIEEIRIAVYIRFCFLGAFDFSV